MLIVLKQLEQSRPMTTERHAVHHEIHQLRRREDARGIKLPTVNRERFASTLGLPVPKASVLLLLVTLLVQSLKRSLETSDLALKAGNCSPGC
jgi:hypothetical protein